MKKILIIFLLLPFLKINAQEHKVVQLSGIVKNESNEALPYVHILIKNSRRGTISDFWGYFSLVVQEKNVIILSSVGYKKKRIIIPDSIKGHDYSVDIIMERDTIMINETVIFPWMNYEQFKEAFINLNIPDDDIERAKKNIALAKKHEKFDETVYPETAYKQYQQLYYDRLYYKGQFPPNQLLNPFAWAKFFEAVKNGDFKQKKDDD